MRHRLLSTAVIAGAIAVASATIAGVQETTPERSLSTACYDALMNLFGVGDSSPAPVDVTGKAAAGKVAAVGATADKPWRDRPMGIHIECTITTEMINSAFRSPAVSPRIIDERPTLASASSGLPVTPGTLPVLRNDALDPRGFSITFEGRGFFAPVTSPPFTATAPPIDPKTQATTVSLMGSVTVPGIAGAVADPPMIRIFITSNGELGGDAFRAIVVNQSGAPVTLQPGVVALEPLLQVNEPDLHREIATLSAFPQVTISLDGYCLERQKAAPSAGMGYRIAPAAMQATNEPVGRVLNAAQRLRTAKLLEPDTDPDAYYHSIVQWAIWAEQEKFDRRGFETSFTDFMRKGVAAKKYQWTPELEAAVRELVPNRWRDVSKIVDETRKASPKE